jgi:hypothetical protein
MATKLIRKLTPASRPLKLSESIEIQSRLAEALKKGDGIVGAHCVHELWMRGEMSANIEPMLERLWKTCADTVPEWLPMRHIEWLPIAYEVAGRFKRQAKGRSNLYLILLDYSDSRAEPYGIYVGMSEYSAAARFDQHKGGIRAAGSVLKRGIEPLTGPVLHLQRIKRAEAARIEAELAEALTSAGLFVQGGH